jgi:hypothetical protein
VTYREAPYRERCIECGVSAASRCERCGDPCCAAHVYSNDGLCAECEGEFLRRSATDEQPSRRAGLGASAVMAVAGTIGQMGGGFAWIMVGGIGAGLVAAAAHLGGGWRRRRYVDERRRLRLVRVR